MNVHTMCVDSIDEIISAPGPRHNQGLLLLLLRGSMKSDAIGPCLSALMPGPLQVIRCLLGIEFHDAKLPEVAKKRGGKAQKKKQKKTKRGITGEVLNVFEQSDAGAHLAESPPPAPPYARLPCLAQPRLRAPMLPLFAD